MPKLRFRGEDVMAKHLRVPVSPKQEQAIKARAEELDLTIADYLRSLAQRDIEDFGTSGCPWPLPWIAVDRDEQEMEHE